MSVMIVPADIYRSILQDTYGRYRRAGMEPPIALARAMELMENAFVCADAADQEDFQWDWHSPESNRWSDETQLKPQT